MRRTFLGDALDHWKGSVLSVLAEGGCLRDLAVDAMLTDPNEWQQIDRDLYAALLRVPVEHIFIDLVAIAADRVAHFRELLHEGDLFLDPDTGVRTGWVLHHDRYVTPQEIETLLPPQQERLLVVYQHVRQRHVRDRVETVATALRTADAAIVGCSCESSNAALLFVSHSPGRVRCAYNALTAFFQPVAQRRVFLWPPHDG